MSDDRRPSDTMRIVGYDLYAALLDAANGAVEVRLGSQTEIVVLDESEVSEEVAT